jgi:hypothetical protein
VETAIWEGEPRNAMLFCPVEAESPYDPTSCTFFNMKGLTGTLKSIGFEIIGAELLPLSKERLSARNYARGFVDYVRKRLAGDPLPIKRVNRGIVLSRLGRLDNDAFVNRYWEATHDFHTLHGG